MGVVSRHYMALDDLFCISQCKVQVYVNGATQGSALWLV